MTCYALVCASALLTPGYSATARRWVADNSDSGNWSEPGNWQPAGVPQGGDDLLFEITSEDPFPLQNMINDLTGLSIRKLEFCSDGWSLAGNELAIGQYVGPRLAGTNVCAFRSFRFDCPLKLAGPTRMDTGYSSTLILKGYIDLNGYDLLLDSRDIFIVSGEIRGTGNVTASLDAFNGHDSKITFDGPVGNTFSGKLIIRQLYDDTGAVIFDKQFGAVVNDALLIGERSPVVTPATRATCKLARSHQIGDSAEVCVTGGSNFLLDGHTETIGSLSLTNVSGDTQPSLVDTGGSTLSVQGDITAVNDSPLVIPTIRGKLGLPGPAPAPAMTNEAQTRALRRRSITK